eukprot:XP_001695946.1 predicted protein [Chlamydomonas reinhardtii]
MPHRPQRVGLSKGPSPRCVLAAPKWPNPNAFEYATHTTCWARSAIGSDRIHLWRQGAFDQVTGTVRFVSSFCSDFMPHTSPFSFNQIPAHV